MTITTTTMTASEATKISMMHRERIKNHLRSQAASSFWRPSFAISHDSLFAFETIHRFRFRENKRPFNSQSQKKFSILKSYRKLFISNYLFKHTFLPNKRLMFILKFVGKIWSFSYLWWLIMVEKTNYGWIIIDLKSKRSFSFPMIATQWWKQQQNIYSLRCFWSIHPCLWFRMNQTV